MNAIRLNVLVSKELHRRAKALAAWRGDTLSDIVRSALEDYIEEMEDSALLDAIEQRAATGEERTHSHEEVWAELDGLPD